MEGNQVSRDGGTIWSYSLSYKVKWRLLLVFSSFMVTLISADQHEWSSGRVCDLHWSFDISGIWVITGIRNALPQHIYNIGPGQTITKGSRYFRDPVSERHRKTEVDPVSRGRMKQKESRRLSQENLEYFYNLTQSVASQLLARPSEEQKDNSVSILLKKREIGRNLR